MSTIFSGIQPSGTLHLGNYLGALQQWVELQTGHTCYFCIVDQHAITVPYEPADLPKRVLDAAAMYIATGIDPEKSTIFVQSHVGAHTELAWLLATITLHGDLTRMTQFKDKIKKHAVTTLGLFAYPVLMAADILLYQTNRVPVGQDQVQHIELARSIAERFNNKFGQTFTVPEALLTKAARVMSLTDPAKKMSKSDAPLSYIALTDPPETIRKKIMSAVTETESIFTPVKSGLPAEASAKTGPAVKNLLNIYAALSGEQLADIEQKFAGKGYKDFKEALAELVTTKLSPLQEKFTALRQDEAKLKEIMAAGAAKASNVAQQTIIDVKQRMGLI